MDHLIDPDTAAFEDQWHFTHMVRSRGLLFLAGVTGTRPDGTVDTDPHTQFDVLFDHLHQYLAAAGAGFEHLVEITTYHVDLSAHLEAFIDVKDDHLPRPYPAWSAIGVDQLITPGAFVELRAVAEAPS